MKSFLLYSLGMLICIGLLATSHCLADTYAYIPSFGSDGVTRVETDDETFISVDLSDGDGPYGAAVMPDGSFVVVTNTDSHTLSKITNTNFEQGSSVVTISLPSDSEPRGVAIESEGGYAYVANYANNDVSKINLGTFTVSGDPISVGTGPWGVAAIYDEVDDTRKVYVSNYLDSTISVIIDDGSDSTNETLDFDEIDGPVGVALTPDGQYLYVANNDDNPDTEDTVTIIQTSNNTIVDTLPVGNGPWGVAVGSDGTYVYVTNSEDDTVTVITTSNQQVNTTIGVGDQPKGVAAPRNGDFAYVVNQGDNSISKIDILTREVEEVDSNEMGAYALGAFIGGTPPARPTGLSAEAETDDISITLTWTDNSSDYLGFKIERRLDGDDAFTQIDKVDANTTTYTDTDTDLEEETTYDYRIRSFNEAADSTFSSTATATTDEDQFSWCFIGALLQ